MISFLSFIFFVNLIGSTPGPSDQECKAVTDKLQRPAEPVLMDDLYAGILKLKASPKAESLFSEITEPMKTELKEIFGADSYKKSKLSQFYEVLYFIGENSLALRRENPKKKDLIDFEVGIVRELLVTSKVFKDPKVPNSIIRVQGVFIPSTRNSRFLVTFDKPETRFALNDAKGFMNYREGKCQVAKELVLYSELEIRMRRLPVSKNVMVTFDSNVDLFGDFGSRGIVDVDLNYVSLRSLELHRGTAEGTVRAKVSRREFEVNDHSWLLSLVTRLVTDKSRQPLDW